ncbi:hypothetical protein [Succinimonas sp.]|uniref:hypothetical protein n=1 Tax=Succinimonas sp. TaxID=1936151 RepID=UPI003865D1D4
MSEWDFLWDEGLTPDEIRDALSSGATAREWAYLEEQERKERERQKRTEQRQRRMQALQAKHKPARAHGFSGNSAVVN